jgi:iron complex outermembrane receptor protein
MGSGSFSKHLLRTAALGVVLTTLGAGAAFAQTPQQTVQQTPPDQVPPPPENNGEGDTVTVTGSRLPSQFASASPMDVIVASDAAAEGISDVASLLRASTVAAGSPQITAISSTAFVQDGGVGTETISLRGLGSNRTLVLLNGRRAGPAGTRGSVGAFDLNVVPLSAVERIEILKDGASSIYGSDAVAGVVNIITKHDDTSSLDFFYKGTQDGGGEELRFSGSFGGEIGNFSYRVSADYYHQWELIRGDRDFFACGQPNVYNADGSRADLVDPRTGDYTCSNDLLWGHIWFYDYASPGAISRPWRARPQLFQYNYGNNLQQYLPGLVPGTPNHGLHVPNGWFPVGYGELSLPGQANDPVYSASARNSDALLNYHHPYVDLTSIQPEVERMTVLGSGEYDLNDHVQLYGEILLNRRTTRASGYRQFWDYQYVYDYGGGDFIGDPVAIAQGWTGDNVGFSPTAITDHNRSTITVDYIRAVGGARGDLDFMIPGWTWEASLQFSRSDGDYKDDVIYTDAVDDYSFRSSLCAGTTTRYRGVPCVDVNWYSPEFQNGNPTAAERAFLFGSETGNTIYEQTTFEAYAAGEMFKLPAGNIGAVIGIQYQDDRINDVPAQAQQDGELWGSSAAGITAGNDDTRAVFTELAIPLFKDLPGAEEVTFTASGRYTDVASYGGASTYKLGLNWEIIPGLRLRASKGTSFRSPALFELYLFNETSFLGQRAVDPCINWAGALATGAITQRVATNCAADGIPGNHNGAGAGVTIFKSGGIGVLNAETSVSKTIGLVWTPDFVDLQLSIDYFDIQVSDEVAAIGANNIVGQCYASLNHSTDPLCDLFQRNGPGGSTAYLITTVRDSFVNIASQGNRGVDFDLVYRTDLPWGDLTTRLQVSKQLEDEQQLLPTSAPRDFNGEIGDPEWVGNIDLVWKLGDFEFFYGARYVGETSNREHFGNQAQTYYGAPVTYILETDAFVYHSASIAYEFPWDLTGRIGVTNILDEEPPVVSEISGEYSVVGSIPVTASQYDFFGRSIFVNFTKRF